MDDFSPHCTLRSRSMVEQPHSGEGHDHVVFVAFGNDQIVTDGTARLGDILHAAGFGPLDVVGKGEESVGTQSHAIDGAQERALVLFGQPLGLLGEVVLPDAVGTDILLISVDVAVNDDQSGRADSASWGADGERRCPPWSRPDGCNGCGTADPRPRRWPARRRQSTRSWTGCI